MDHMWARVGSDLIARVTGPMKFRLVLQPAMACFLAIRAGIADGKNGKPPYFWALLWNPDHRLFMIKEGWKSIGRVFLLAIAMDVVYQIIVRRFVYPGEAIIVAIVLAIVPYLIVRGLVTRATRRLNGKLQTTDKRPPMGKAA